MSDKITMVIDLDNLDKIVGMKESQIELIKNHPNRHRVANALFRMSMDLGIEIE